MSLPPLDARPHALYRFYNQTQQLLYIGITSRLPVRLGTHEALKPWWCDVADVKVEHFPDRVSVLAAEAAAIRAEKPLHNVRHNGPRPKRPGGGDRPESYPGLPTWDFASRRGGGRRRHVPLWLYWEVRCDPVSDDFYVDEIDPEELWRYWLDSDPRHEDAEAIYGRGAVAIYWYVEGPGIFEFAPLQDQRSSVHAWRRTGSSADEVRDMADHHGFLQDFTWPTDSETGERLQWASLPVIDKVWRKTNLPTTPHAYKGGFIQEATGWKPAPFQPYVNVRQLAALSGLYYPTVATEGDHL